MENLMNFFFTDVDGGYANPFEDLRGGKDVVNNTRFDPAALNFRLGGDPNVVGNFCGGLLFDETSTEGNFDPFAHHDTVSIKLEEAASPFLHRDLALPLSCPAFRQLPFHITRPSNLSQAKVNEEEQRQTAPSFVEMDKMMSKSKRIIKREKAKCRKLTKEVNPEIKAAITEEMAEYQHLDRKAKKKMVQVIRNRISAQNSRDRKKMYVTNLEGENEDLKKERLSLLARIAELEASVSRTEKAKSERQSWESVIKSGSRGTGNNITLLSLITFVVFVLMASHGSKSIEGAATKVLSGSLPLLSSNVVTMQDAQKMIEKISELGKDFKGIKEEEPSNEMVEEKAEVKGKDCATLFCPMGVIFEPEGASDGKDALQSLEESKLLQLILPSSALSTINELQQIAEEGELPRSLTPVTDGTEAAERKERLLQLICQVKSIRTLPS